MDHDGYIFSSFYVANLKWCLTLRTNTENTPLQLKLNILAELIAKVGSVAGIILFTVLMLRFFVQLGTGNPPW